MSFGEVWFTFEEVWQYPMTAVWGLDNLQWDDFDVVVLPRGWYSIEEALKDQIADWVRQGGQLIALDAACNVGLDSWGLSRHDGDDDKAERQDEREAHQRQDQYAPYAMSDRNGIRSDIPGAIYSISLDNTHPLAFGYGNRYWSLKTGSRRYAPLEAGSNVGWLGESPSPISGFAGTRANASLRLSLIHI